MDLFVDLISEFRLPPVTTQLGKEKIDATQKILKAVADRYHITDYLDCNLEEEGGPFNLIACATTRYVYLPPLYFLDRKTIPFTGANDPTLDDRKKVQEFAHSVSKTFNLKLQKVGIRDEMNVRLFLKFWESREQAQQALKFVLLHELGHIYHRHWYRSAAYEAKLKKPLFLIINLLTLGIFRCMARLKQSRNHEKEADAFACKSSTEAARGGIYLFKTIKEYRFRSSAHILRHTLSTFIASFTHTSLSSRILSIEKHLSNSNP